MASVKKLDRFKLKLVSDVLSKQTVIKDKSSIKNYHEIPTKNNFIPHSIRLIFDGGPSYLHEHCDKRHRELGPIFREHLGANELIFLADNHMIRTVVANEGQYPHHNVPESWAFYNDIHNVQRGLFFQTGENWMKLRKAFNKVMLADPKVMNKFNKNLVEINNDLIQYWISKSRNGSTEGSLVLDDLKKDLCRWSIESTGFMLFGRRMGCVQQSNSHDTRADELVENVAAMFSETSRFQLLPVALAQKWDLGSWRRFEEATTNMLRIASDYTKENMRNDSSTNSLVSGLLKNEALNVEELSRSVIDLIIAAADTTSNSLQWMLYLLSKHRDVQSKILTEVQPFSSALTTDDLNNFMDNIPYLKSFVREVYRLYPTAPFLARTLDTPIVLNGYHIPPGKPIVFSLYTTSRMEKYFENPLEFRPERWLRNGPLSEVNCATRVNSAHASLPFGIGKRMCIGRRAAELEMCLFIASFVSRFRSSPVDEDIGIKLNMILSPSKPIVLDLEQRAG